MNIILSNQDMIDKLSLEIRSYNTVLLEELKEKYSGNLDQGQKIMNEFREDCFRNYLSDAMRRLVATSTIASISQEGYLFEFSDNAINVTAEKTDNEFPFNRVNT